MFDVYADEFHKLNVDRSSGRAKPHKVCLLFAVFDLIEDKQIPDNRIFFNDQLKARFTYYFNKLSADGDRDNPSLPFFHLRSSSFWHHKLRSAVNHKHKYAVSEKSLGTYIEYAYLNDDLFALLQNENHRNALRQCLTQNLSELGEQFKRWAVEIGKSEKTAKNYVSALKTTMPNWMKTLGNDVGSIFELSSLSEFKLFERKLRETSIFQERDFTGKRMYSAALKAYEDFLSDTTQVQLQEDIDDILKDDTKTVTEKSVLVKARVGQGKYRQDLIDLWGKCALTGLENRDFLIASHIKPWRDSSETEKLDKYNGLLLVANLDRAFDKGYISFDETGDIMISKELEEYTKLGISSSGKLHINEQSREYLLYHREMLFRI
ncbi:MAG: HNH endonuclease [Alteromonadaceae bacterium]|nr:HNH endonuclease [Alteromonadaceae bacterium]